MISTAKTLQIFGTEPGVTPWLDSEPDNNNDWIVDNLIYRGTITMLDGMGNSGKSYIALQLAVAIATGQPFLGLLPTQEGKVLVLNGEDPEPITHSRFRSVAQNYADDDVKIYQAAEKITYVSMSQTNTNSILFDEKLQPTAAYQELMRFCGVWNPDLVILDPLIMFIANENNPVYAMQFYLAMRKLNSTILVLHHNNKSAMDANSTLEDRAKARGTTVWTENTKTRMYLKNDTIFVEKNNFSLQGKYKIGLKFDRGMWFGRGIEHEKKGFYADEINNNNDPFGDIRQAKEVNLIPTRGRKRRKNNEL